VVSVSTTIIANGLVERVVGQVKARLLFRRRIRITSVIIVTWCLLSWGLRAKAEVLVRYVVVYRRFRIRDVVIGFGCPFLW
jgi:hypothetical protein